MKLHFLGPGDTPLADPNTAALEAVRAELLAAGGIAEAASPAAADAIILAERYSFKEWRYIDRLLADPALGPNLHRVYTINTDDCATGLLRGAYTSLPRRRFDPAIHAAVPYAHYPNRLVLEADAAPSGPPRHLATWRGNPKSNPRLRRRLLRCYAGSPHIVVAETSSWLNHSTDEQRSYVELLRSGRFSLCPAGWAPATFRIYESMALGVAPVIIADACVLPAGPRWEECSLRVPERKLGELARRLEARAGDASALGRNARHAWAEHFSPDRVMACHAAQLLGCLKLSLGTGDLAREKRRMRSLRTYWQNRWTVPQRLLRRMQRLKSAAA